MLGAFSIAVWLLGPPVQRPDHDAARPLALNWSAPDTCPGPGPTLEQIEHLAPGLTHRADSSVEIRVELEPSPGGIALALTIHDRHGELHRNLEAADCEEAQRAASLLIAVFLDPVASAQTLGRARTSAAHDDPPRHEPEPEPKPEPEPEPEPENWRSQRGESNSSPAPQGLRLGVRTFVGGGFGPTDTGTATLGGALAILGSNWRAELGGAWTLPRTVRRGPQLGGTFDGWFILARGCFVPTLGPRARIELPLCPTLELGRVHGRGVDELPVALEAAFTWFAIGVGQGLVFVPIDRLAIGVELQLAVPLQGGRFSIGDQEIQRLTPVGVRALAGVELRLP